MSGRSAVRSALRARSKAERNNLANAGQAVKLIGNESRDRIIDRNQRDGLSGLLPAAEVEGRDIDPVLTKLGAKSADEARLVVIDDVNHLAGKLCLDRDAEDLDQ